jgi:hypothetical protein
LVCQDLHFGGFHLDMMAEIEIAGVVERHQVDVGVRDIDSYDGNTDLNAGTNLFEATRDSAAEAVQFNEEVVVEVENIIDLLFGDAEHVAAHYGIDIEKCQTVVGFGHLVAGYLACNDT